MLWEISLLAIAIPIDIPNKKIVNPDQHVRAAIDFLQQNREAHYIRLFSFWDTKKEELFDKRRYLAWSINQMSLQRAVRVPLEVPDTDGRLVWIDLRWYGWNCRAWEAVAKRDPFSTEPPITHINAEILRKIIGCDKIEPIKHDDGLETIPAVAFVNAEWFIRETVETQRGKTASTSYYDLIFARFRFPDNSNSGETEEYETEEKVYEPQWIDQYNRVHPGQYVTKKVKKTRKLKNQGFVDFPANIEELEKVIGVDKVRAFAKETEIDLDFGAIVAGGADDEVHGSIVALNNRLIVIIPTPWGWYMRTYDVFETTGDRDYSEKLIFKKGNFRRGDGADAVFDAGEILYSIPNGGQGSFLINGAGKRAEFAAQQIAMDSSNKKLNIGVTVGCAGRCAVCHGPTGGFILPKDQEKEDRTNFHIKRKFRDKEQEQRYKDFTSEWEDDSKYITSRYERMIKESTIHPALYGEKQYNGSKISIMEYSTAKKLGEIFGKASVLGTMKDVEPWTGSRIAAETDKQVRAYDSLVSPERAARKLGIPVEMLKRLCIKAGATEDGKVRNHRLNQLLQDKAIPSRTFEVDIYRKLAYLLDAYRIDPEYKK